LIESSDQFDELIGIIARALRRIGIRSAAAESIEPPRDIVQAAVNVGKFVGVIVVEPWLDARLRRRVDDDGVKPLAKWQARPARRFFRTLARFRPDSFYAPWHAKFHSLTCLRGGGAKSLLALVEPARINGEWKTGGPHSTRRLFAVHGKQAV